MTDEDAKRLGSISKIIRFGAKLNASLKRSASKKIASVPRMPKPRAIQVQRDL